MAVELRLIPCLEDNYAVLLHDPATRETALVDAPEAPPIIAALEETGWRLTRILVTHHHSDHTAGIEALCARYAPEVTAPAAEAERIPRVDRRVRAGDEVRVGSLAAEVIETPGHTAGHICFHFPHEHLLFAGDTLFPLGCGRVIESPPATMWSSLDKLRRLPDETRVYAGHEYALGNARFAVTVDPDNAALEARLGEVERTRAAGRPAMPSTIGEERRTNPFLRADDPAVAAGVGLAGADPAAVFAEIRSRKNRFR